MSDVKKIANSGETEILRQRMDKLQRLKDEEHFNPYEAESWPREQYIANILEQFKGLEEDQGDDSVELKVAGRLMTIRRQGKAAFAHLRDETGTMQIYVQFNALGEEAYTFFKKWIDSGDIVGVVGHPFRTKRGELTIAVHKIDLLSKALRPLPEKWHGLTELETRYRKRYIDLISNPEVGQTFIQRSKIISSVRRTLESHGTLEVETPVLSYLAGGAEARPFITHHNTLNLEMYLRIAVELHLKRLVVGGMGRIYELGKMFRNEGMDLTHNPEFTMLEVYWPYSDYKDMMDLTEDVVRQACLAANGSTEAEYDGKVIDFAKPFRRVTMQQLVKEKFGYDFDTCTDEQARQWAKAKGVEVSADASRYKVLAGFVEDFIEDDLVEPTFLIGHPKEISPLAKSNPENTEITQRFELFVHGKELANGYSELNDPIDQKERFIEQMNKKAEGDEEAHPYDEDFVEALEQGMPPTGGLGIGIDRLVMFLTGNKSIRDVIFFPTMKPIGYRSDQAGADNDDE